MISAYGLQQDYDVVNSRSQVCEFESLLKYKEVCGGVWESCLTTLGLILVLDTQQLGRPSLSESVFSSAT